MKLLLMIAAMSLTSVANAQSGQDRDTAGALETLKILNEGLAKVESTVETYEVGRLLFLESLVKSTQESIGSKGLGHAATFRAYQTLVISFNHSQDYFARIETDSTKNSLAALGKIIAQISDARGIDESPSLITNSVFVQMEKLFRDLLSLHPAPPLSTALTDFLPRIGQVTAKSARGDWADVYDLARPFVLELRSLYPLMDKVQKNEPGYAIVWNIQGLIEFYIDFSRAENIGRTN